MGLLLILFLVSIYSSSGFVSSSSFTLLNKCDYTVWPGILANSGSSPLESTGFELRSGGSRSFPAPPNWSGRFWGRTGCGFDPGTGLGSCVTGDCGSKRVECGGAGAAPPATLAEFTVAAGGQDFYDVSLVDGYNVPVIVEAVGGSGTCLTTGCVTDLNQQCPAELRVGSGQACMSACEAFGSPEYCCSGAYGTPDACRPSVYSEMFKATCPRAYSYAYDDPTSTFTCSGADYTITFCPATSSQKAAATDTSPTTNGSGSGAESGSGSGPGFGSGPIGVNTTTSTSSSSSWLPDFFIGADSSKNIPNSPSTTIWLLFLLSLFL